MDDAPDDPVSLSLLADLQAGLLDDRTAARLRRRARTDPEVAAHLAGLDRVRRDVAELGVDAASAPDVPAAVTARIGTALRESARPPAPGWNRAAALIGLGAVALAVGIGTVVLLRDDTASGAEGSSGPAAPSQGSVPLSDAQLLDLLAAPPDLGPLGAPRRLASCLAGLGYPTSTPPLGAEPLEVGGRAGVLLLLTGDAPRHVDAVVVAPNCSSVDTGLLARTVVNRP